MAMPPGSRTRLRSKSWSRARFRAAGSGSMPSRRSRRARARPRSRRRSRAAESSRRAEQTRVRSCRDWPSSAPAALRYALDELVRCFLRRTLLIAWPATAQDTDHFVDHRDRQDREAADKADLRNPQRNGDDALCHVVEAPGVVGHLRRISSEIENEGCRHPERYDLGRLPGSPMQALQQETDADHFAAFESVSEAEKSHRGHAPGCEIVTRGNVDGELPADRHDHHDREDRDHENAGRVAGAEIEKIKSTPEQSRRRHVIVLLRQCGPHPHTRPGSAKPYDKPAGSG